MTRRATGTTRRGPLLATILRKCFEPSDAVSIAEHAGINRNGALRIMRHLYGMGLVHIGGWTEGRFGKPPAVLWKAGAGEDVPRPIGKWRGVAYQARQTLPHAPARLPTDTIAFAHAIRAMQERAVSADQIGEVTGWAHTTVTRFLRHCRRIGLIHIGEWHRTAKNVGVWARMYQYGNEPDAPRPKAIPRSVVERRSNLARRQKARDIRMAHALAANATAFTQAA